MYSLPAVLELLQGTTLNMFSAHSGRLSILNTTHQLDAHATFHIKDLQAVGVSVGDLAAALGEALRAAGLDATMSASSEPLHVILPQLPHIKADQIAAAFIPDEVARRLHKDGSVVHFRVTIDAPRTSDARARLVAALFPVLLADVSSFFEIITMNHQLHGGNRAGRLRLLITEHDRAVVLTKQAVLPMPEIVKVLGHGDTRRFAAHMHGVRDAVAV